MNNNEYLNLLTNYAKASGAFAYVKNVIMQEVIFPKMM